MDLRRRAALLVALTIVGCQPDLTPTSATLSEWDWSGPATVGAAVVCTPQVGFLGQGGCTLAVDPSAVVGPVTWRFESDDGWSGVVRTVSGQGSLDWYGSMAISGTVSATFQPYGGPPATLQDHITVTRRNWSWAGSVGGSQGAPGEIDECFAGPQVVGKMAGSACSSVYPTALFSHVPSGGYSTHYVDPIGPNANLWYVKNASITMDLRTQVNRRYRADADTLDVPMGGDPAVTAGCGPQRRTHHHVHTSGCAAPKSFASMVAWVWHHEGLHMSRALYLAGTPQGDLHKMWEALVRPDPPLVDSTAVEQRDLVEVWIADGALCTHTGITPHFDVWWNVGGGWQATVLAGDESIPAHC